MKGAEGGGCKFALEQHSFDFDAARVVVRRAVDVRAHWFGDELVITARREDVLKLFRFMNMRIEPQAVIGRR
jgi:hypothetical protein